MLNGGEGRLCRKGVDTASGSIVGLARSRRYSPTLYNSATRDDE
jgi:hypothetical protein